MGVFILSSLFNLVFSGIKTGISKMINMGMFILSSLFNLVLLICHISP
jgi:hypothetical protein